MNNGSPVDTLFLPIGLEDVHLMLWYKCAIPLVSQAVWCAFPLAVRMASLTFEAAARLTTA
jgi:hypothetical protein